jgi:hypothetical protein
VAFEIVVIFMWSECMANCLTRPGQSRHDRAYWNLEYFRDLLIGELLTSHNKITWRPSTGSCSIASRMAATLDFSINSDSGLAQFAHDKGNSSSLFNSTASRRSSVERELRKCS